MGLLLLMIAFSYVVDTSSQTEFSPAEISTSATDVVEGETLKLKCVFSTAGMHGSEHLHIYLCKNGVGIKIETWTASKDTTFMLADVNKEDSGNYSCLYSNQRHAANTMTAVGQNSIFIEVKDVGVAKIFVGNMTVYEGTNVFVKCAVFEAKPQSTLHMYLCKNGTGISMEVAHGGDATFTLFKIRIEDSGSYSCVYSIKKHHPANVRSTNENSVIIQVRGNDQGSDSRSGPKDHYGITQKALTPQHPTESLVMMRITIPIISLCVIGAMSYLCRRTLKRCLMPNTPRQTQGARDPEIIYREAMLCQTDEERDPCSSETQQTDVIYNNAASGRAKKKSNCQSSEVRETQQTDVIYSEPTHIRAKKKTQPRSSPTDVEYSSISFKDKTTPGHKKEQHDNNPTEHLVFGEIMT